MAVVRPDVNPVAFSDVVGVESDANRMGVIGSNAADSSFGFLAGRDLVFQQHVGVYGQSDQQGVMGIATTDAATGVFGGSRGGAGFGVRGESNEGVAIQGQSFSGRSGLAGRFIGNVRVQGNPGTSSGDLRVDGTASFGGSVEITGNLNMSSPTSDIVLADIAEDFGVQPGAVIDPGTVVVLDQLGRLRPGDDSYDRKVAGVVCGAGKFRPAIILDRQPAESNSLSVALTGKVCCKVDAQYSPIEVGDLLTTSPTEGHAMKASDPSKAFGAVIGKALHPLPLGQGMIPILVALQ